MKIATKKSQGVKDSDIDGPMMGGKFMTKEESLKMQEFIKKHKSLTIDINSKKRKN